MTKKNSVSFFLLFAIVFLILNSQVRAQKIPSKQSKSLRIGSKVSIDGVNTELGGKFEAFNPATDLFYSIGNNDKSLYLVFQVNNPDVINRIGGGGISFMIKSADDKEKSDISLTYPVHDKNKMVVFKLLTPKGKIPDTSKTAADSIAKINNKRASENFKWIKVSGVKNLDTISIYNDEGIEMAGKFDAKKNYTVEMLIPLDIIRNEFDNSNAFNYQIQVNGAPPLSVTFGPVVGSTDPAAAARVEREMNLTLEKLNTVKTSVTNFSGKYKLAK